MDLKKILGAVAPTLATALLGPVGGLAVQAIGSALGIDEPTQEKIADAFKSGQLNGEQIVAVKNAEQAFLVRCKELDIDLDRIHAGNTASARDMQKQTSSKIPGILAIFITAGFFSILIGMMTGWFKATGNSDALLIMLGALGAAWGAVVNFYYGSSRGSDEKTAILARKP